MLVKLFVPIQLDVISVRSVVLANSSNHQLLVSLSFAIMSIMSIVFTNLSKHLTKQLPNLSVPAMQVIPSFIIPLVSPFLILLVNASQITMLVNSLMWNILMNDLSVIRTIASMVLQNHLVPWIFWCCPYIFMN